MRSTGTDFAQGRSDTGKFGAPGSLLLSWGNPIISAVVRAVVYYLRFSLTTTNPMMTAAASMPAVMKI